MSKLTPQIEIEKALEEAYDPEYYASLYRQTLFAFGEGWQDTVPGAVAGSGRFPDFPAIRVRSLEVGRSRKILNSQFIDMGRTMYAPGSPEFPQVDKYTAEVRKQFFARRSSDGEWDTERASAFLEGNGLGVGFVQVGFKTNRRTGRQRVHVRHSPTLFTLWDPHERSAGRASYICFVQHLSVNKAIATFGPDVEQYAEETSYDGHKIRSVRIFEYYDLGHGRWEPTMAIIPGSFGEKPLVREASPWKDHLPFAFYEHWIAPGMRRPIGRIPIQMASQMGLNALERRFQAVSKQNGFDIIDLDQVNQEDVKSAMAGNTNVVRMTTPKPGTTPITRIPGQSISNSDLELYRMYEQQFNEDSGTNEYDRGGRPDGNLTAFEVGNIERKSSLQGSWPLKQAAAFAVRLVERVLESAAMGDQDDVEIDLLGRSLKLNDPADARSRISGWLEEPSEVLIKGESLQAQDSLRDQSQRLGALQAVQELVGKTVDPGWFTEQKLRAIGEVDIQPALLPPPPPSPPVVAPEVPGVSGGVPEGVPPEAMGSGGLVPPV
jgi:hypothetical protein